MHPELIKAEIRMRGSSPKRIAQELGLCNSTVAHVIHNRGVSERVRRHIAALIEKPLEEIWPAAKPAAK